MDLGRFGVDRVCEMLGQRKMGMRPMLDRATLLHLLRCHARTSVIVLSIVRSRLFALGFVGTAREVFLPMVYVGLGGFARCLTWPAAGRRCRQPRRPRQVMWDGAGQLRHRRRPLDVESRRRLARGRRRAGAFLRATQGKVLAPWACGLRGKCPSSRPLVEVA